MRCALEAIAVRPPHSRPQRQTAPSSSDCRSPSPRQSPWQMPTTGIEHGCMVRAAIGGQ